MSEAFSNSAAVLSHWSADGSPRLAWYAVQTLYRHEHRIARDLGTKGFPTYLPLVRETHQWSDRKKVLATPAFTGYVFVRQDASAYNRVRVLETPGVVRMVGSSRAPVAIPDVEIESLRRMIESGNSCERCDPPAIGSMVEIVRGPLTGVRGRLLEVRNCLRLVLSVSAVSQAVSVEVDRKDVAPILFASTPAHHDQHQPEALRASA